MSRKSGPLLDRIDLHAEVPSVKIAELTGTILCLKQIPNFASAAAT